MSKLITNVSDRAVGLPGGVTLHPGEQCEMELSKEDLKILKGFEYVEVSDLDRSVGSRDTGANAQGES
jgi:hypothetical protein